MAATNSITNIQWQASGRTHVPTFKLSIYSQYLIRYNLRKRTPLKNNICRHQWHADTIKKVDISCEQQSWYFCTFFMAKHLSIWQQENNIT